MTTKPKAIIVDIDGTLSDVTHRLRHIEGTTKNWDRFNQESAKDKPIFPVCEMVRHFQTLGYALLLVTGRDAEYHTITTTWLAENEIVGDMLLMRRRGDYRSDWLIKKEAYESHIKDNYEVLLALEDRDAVVEMWRSLGITCLQVQKGAY